ncbi:hypothetical protein BS47DRAFT_1338693 [Hydnum rufescens UP504]|uniref:Uncharacterized protein n=1 Tax=Hydnum rufescens UP504 TaxID=1448309 RepID=A0A9P6B5I5_9AGAM|nr:hypothetical protein BS47DRAFT_1338693 [Hydnum rufescens UP504]
MVTSHGPELAATTKTTPQTSRVPFLKSTVYPNARASVLYRLQAILYPKSVNWDTDHPQNDVKKPEKA